jgi:hypothetical protein
MKIVQDARLEVLTVVNIIIMIIVYQTRSLTALNTAKLHTEALQKSEEQIYNGKNNSL